MAVFFFIERASVSCVGSTFIKKYHNHLSMRRSLTKAVTVTKGEQRLTKYVNAGTRRLSTINNALALRVLNRRACFSQEASKEKPQVSAVFFAFYGTQEGKASNLVWCHCRSMKYTNDIALFITSYFLLKSPGRFTPRGSRVPIHWRLAKCLL